MAAELRDEEIEKLRATIDAWEPIVKGAIRRTAAAQAGVNVRHWRLHLEHEVCKLPAAFFPIGYHWSEVREHADPSHREPEAPEVPEDPMQPAEREDLRAMIARWRLDAGRTTGCSGEGFVIAALRSCADELEAALETVPPVKQ